MATERERKRIDETTSTWQQIKNSFTPGMQGEQAQQSAQPSDTRAMIEAMRKRRAQGYGS